jgi:integrase
VLRNAENPWSGFFAYIAGPAVSTGALYASNLMDAVTRPNPKPPPIRFYELREIGLLLAQAPSREMRALWALLYATSIDISTAIQLRRQDFDEDQREVRAPGTKAHARDRICRVADWAWDIVAEFLEDKQLADELWPGWNRWTPTDVHKVAAKAAGLRPLLPLRCSRHAWAVRAAKAGTPIAVIAAQLGHGSPQLVLTRYGRFMPQATDRDRWEKRASERDAEILRSANAAPVAFQAAFQAPMATHRVETNKARKPLGSRALSNSRGGTRTRDPGIMSAVL